MPLPITSSTILPGSTVCSIRYAQIISMDVAALSYCMNAAKLQNDIGFAVMGNVLDQVETAGDGMIKILESSVTPYLGQNIDYAV